MFSHPKIKSERTHNLVKFAISIKQCAEKSKERHNKTRVNRQTQIKTCTTPSKKIVILNTGETWIPIPKFKFNLLSHSCINFRLISITNGTITINKKMIKNLDLLTNKLKTILIKILRVMRWGAILREMNSNKLFKIW